MVWGMEDWVFLLLSSCCVTLRLLRNAAKPAWVWFKTEHTALGCQRTAKSTCNPVQERQVTVTAIWGWVLLWSDRFCLLGETKDLILHLRPFNLIREKILCWNAGQALQYKV